MASKVISSMSKAISTKNSPHMMGATNGIAIEAVSLADPYSVITAQAHAAVNIPRIIPAIFSSVLLMF